MGGVACRAPRARGAGRPPGSRGLALAVLAVSPALAQESVGLPGLPRREGLHRRSGKGRTVSLYVAEKAFAGSIHGSLAVRELPRRPRGQGAAARRAAPEGGLRRLPRDGGEAARGLAPRPGDEARRPARPDAARPATARTTSGRSKDPASPVSPLKVPFTCGKCHQEGTVVMRQRNIHQDHILENYSESIHGEGLLKKGLDRGRRTAPPATPPTTSCPTPTPRPRSPAATSRRPAPSATPRSRTCTGR